MLVRESGIRSYDPIVDADDYKNRKSKTKVHLTVDRPGLDTGSALTSPASEDSHPCFAADKSRIIPLERMPEAYQDSIVSTEKIPVTGLNIIGISSSRREASIGCLRDGLDECSTVLRDIDRSNFPSPGELKLATDTSEASDPVFEEVELMSTYQVCNQVNQSDNLTVSHEIEPITYTLETNSLEKPTPSGESIRAPVVIESVKHPSDGCTSIDSHVPKASDIVPILAVGMPIDVFTIPTVIVTEPVSELSDAIDQAAANCIQSRLLYVEPTVVVIQPLPLIAEPIVPVCEIINGESSMPLTTSPVVAPSELATVDETEPLHTITHSMLIENTPVKNNVVENSFSKCKFADTSKEINADVVSFDEVVTSSSGEAKYSHILVESSFLEVNVLTTVLPSSEGGLDLLNFPDVIENALIIPITEKIETDSKEDNTSKPPKSNLLESSSKELPTILYVSDVVESVNKILREIVHGEKVSDEAVPIDKSYKTRDSVTDSEVAVTYLESAFNFRTGHLAKENSHEELLRKKAHCFDVSIMSSLHGTKELKQKNVIQCLTKDKPKEAFMTNVLITADEKRTTSVLDPKVCEAEQSVTCPISTSVSSITDRSFIHTLKFPQSSQPHSSKIIGQNDESLQENSRKRLADAVLKNQKKTSREKPRQKSDASTELVGFIRCNVLNEIQKDEPDAKRPRTESVDKKHHVSSNSGISKLKSTVEGQSSRTTSASSNLDSRHHHSGSSTSKPHGSTCHIHSSSSTSERTDTGKTKAHGGSSPAKIVVLENNRKSQTSDNKEHRRSSTGDAKKSNVKELNMSNNQETVLSTYQKHSRHPLSTKDEHTDKTSGSSRSAEKSKKIMESSEAEHRVGAAVSEKLKTSKSFKRKDDKQSYWTHSGTSGKPNGFTDDRVRKRSILSNHSSKISSSLAAKHIDSDSKKKESDASGNVHEQNNFVQMPDLLTNVELEVKAKCTVSEKLLHRVLDTHSSIDKSDKVQKGIAKEKVEISGCIENVQKPHYKPVVKEDCKLVAKDDSQHQTEHHSGSNNSSQLPSPQESTQRQKDIHNQRKGLCEESDLLRFESTIYSGTVAALSGYSDTSFTSKNVAEKKKLAPEKQHKGDNSNTAIQDAVFNHRKLESPDSSDIKITELRPTKQTSSSDEEEKTAFKKYTEKFSPIDFKNNKCKKNRSRLISSSSDESEPDIIPTDNRDLIKNNFSGDKKVEIGNKKDDSETEDEEELCASAGISLRRSTISGDLNIKQPSRRLWSTEMHDSDTQGEVKTVKKESSRKQTEDRKQRELRALLGDFGDDVPAYVSMYDVVKRRSTQEREKEQAVKEEKLRSKSLDNMQVHRQALCTCCVYIFDMYSSGYI